MAASIAISPDSGASAPCRRWTAHHCPGIEEGISGLAHSYYLYDLDPLQRHEQNSCGVGIEWSVQVRRMAILCTDRHQSARKSSHRDAAVKQP